MAHVFLYALLFASVFAKNPECVDDVCPMHFDSFMQHKLAGGILQMCPGPCECDQYQSGTIVFSCSKDAGTENISLIIGQSKPITILPKSADGVAIKLNSDADIDLQLYDGDKCVFGYGCTNAEAKKVVDYEGMKIVFSGDDTTAPVEEFITITGVLPRPMRLIVKAYANGTGQVTYSHGAITPCPPLRQGCSKCSDYSLCGAGATLKCDGSKTAQCIPPVTVAPTPASTPAPTSQPTPAPTSTPTPQPTPTPTPVVWITGFPKLEGEGRLGYYTPAKVEGTYSKEKCLDTVRSGRFKIGSNINFFGGICMAGLSAPQWKKNVEENPSLAYKYVNGAIVNERTKECYAVFGLTKIAKPMINDDREYQFTVFVDRESQFSWSTAATALPKNQDC